MNKAALGIFFCLLISACSSSNASDVQDLAVGIKTYTANANFDDVMQNLKDALSDKGLVINTVAHIGSMLERTGKDVGDTKPIFQKAENVEFCSAALSRNMMLADPRTINYCPYIISVYSLPGEIKKTYVSYRKFPRVKDAKVDKTLQDVEQLLDQLAQAAAK